MISSRRAVPAAVVLAVIAPFLAVAGCGGSGSSTMSRGEVAAKVEVACTKLAGYAIWLPEHLQKTAGTLTEAKAIMGRAEGDFRASLESLDPPSDLQAPIDRLTSQASESVSSAAGTSSLLKRNAAAYEQIGATRCAKAMRASIFELKGMSVEDAYDRVGLALPPHPPGW